MKTEHQPKCILGYSYNLHLRSGVGGVQKADLPCDIFFLIDFHLLLFKQVYLIYSLEDASNTLLQ